jgi:regulatory Fis family protein/calcineurin-like phosphoesterase family protein
MAGAPLSRELAQQTMEAMKACGGNMSDAARMVGIARSTFEARYHRAQQYEQQPEIEAPEHAARLHAEVESGIVMVASDAHYWPGGATTMHRAFVRLCKELQPRIVIMNGDVFDGASVSRHPPIGWETMPSVKQELEACQLRLGEIEQAAGKARKIWPLGNHDARFETRLAMQASEYKGVDGVHLKDHMPLWEACWSVFINDCTVVKHRFKGGIHATHNNALWSGKTMVTGHLHSAKVTPLTDYNGTRWGVDSGTLCEAPWPQAIDYLEDNPVNWRSAFAVLTFHKGRLLQPELCLQHSPGECEWRGQVYRV